MDSNWLRVFEHEMSRRRLIYNENKDLFHILHSKNPKGLLYKKDCVDHCWVPATHIMIHDGAKGSIELGKMRRRGFKEAKAYKDNGYSICPQVCWRCDATRERRDEIVSVTERQKRFKAARPTKQRGRRTEPAEPILDELLG